MLRILLLVMVLASCGGSSDVESSHVCECTVDTVYMFHDVDSAEIAVGYLRSNGAFKD
jgi:hypothetical protein